MIVHWKGEIIHNLGVFEVKARSRIHAPQKNEVRRR
jgi:hypothetical protein